jgi:hypothetical protein
MVNTDSIPKGANQTLSQTLDDLDKDKVMFLNSLQRKIYDLVRATDRKDCIAIVHIDKYENRTRIGAFSSSKDWGVGLWKMSRYKGDDLPQHEGKTLDSYLSKPIINLINKSAESS